MSGKPFPKPANPEPYIRRLRRRKNKSLKTIAVLFDHDFMNFTKSMEKVASTAALTTYNIQRFGEELRSQNDHSWAAQQRRIR